MTAADIVEIIKVLTIFVLVTVFIVCMGHNEIVHIIHALQRRDEEDE